MINYGSPPQSNEVEVVVFGPGYGEAIAVHLGDHKWLLADSCIDPSSKQPASLTYLRSIGVDPGQVRTIVATHWHDDHVRGISEIARACADAEFNLSGAFNQKEGVALLAAYSGSVAPGLSRGTSELYSVVRDRPSVFLLHQRSNVFEFVNGGGGRVRVTSFSPSQAAITQAVAHMATFLPVADETHGNAIALNPNHEAVVLHIDLEDDAILLGSDFEDHLTLGWSAIVGDPWCGARRASSAYKVAHHGSSSGDSTHIWTSLLVQDPTVAMTPFNHGSQRLPTEADRARVRAQTRNAYITSRRGRRPNMDSAALKRLADVVDNLAPVNNGFGAVRLRKVDGAPDWTVTCFGDAHSL